MRYAILPAGGSLAVQMQQRIGGLKHLTLNTRTQQVSGKTSSHLCYNFWHRFRR